MLLTLLTSICEDWTTKEHVDNENVIKALPPRTCSVDRMSREDKNLKDFLHIWTLRGKDIQKRNKMAEKGRKDREKQWGLEQAWFCSMLLLLLNVEIFGNVIHNTIVSFSDAVCIKESKTRTPNLIRLCEDVNSTGYEHSKTKVGMLKMMALPHCSLKRVNRNNLLYYMRVPAMCLLAFYLCSQTCRSTWTHRSQICKSDDIVEDFKTIWVTFITANGGGGTASVAPLYLHHGAPLLILALEGLRHF